MSKTNVLLLGALVLTAGILNSVAGDVFLSPRAKDNQIKIVADTPAATTTVTYTVTPASSATLSPKAGSSQVVKIVNGPTNDVNPAAVCMANMTGSPKAKQNCIENPKLMPGCMPVATTVAPLK